MPIYVARGHRENVTDFLFSNHEGKRLLTVSKDGTFNAFDVSDCYRPLEHVPASSVSVGARKVQEDRSLVITFCSLRDLCE